MSKVEIILSITTIVSLITTMVVHKKNINLVNKDKVKVHTCIYNDNPSCYEKACGFCNSKKECNICCGGNCNKCPAHNVEYFERSETDDTKSLE